MPTQEPQIDMPVTSREFEDFIYLISHDVRNSVRALIELPQWIADDLAEAGVKIEGQVADNIDLMNTHTGRLDRMLVDLLTFSRVGRMQDLVEVDLQTAVEDVLDDLKVPAGIAVTVDLECKSLWIGERDILSLLTALLSNAIKHHDKPSGEIILASKRHGQDIVIEVTDDGPGILPEYRERVFMAMATLRPRDEVEGSGMGLTIARKIAQVYGGTVSIIDTGRARGTRLEARFPISE
jgi:signal transduction histidine kinase